MYQWGLRKEDPVGEFLWYYSLVIFSKGFRLQDMLMVMKPARSGRTFL
jgi:hypothetical protein